MYEFDESKIIKAPVEVTKSDFNEMLEILPPMGWVNRKTEESFKISERIHANFVRIFARIGDRYFSLVNVATLKHEEIIRLCSEVAQ